MTTESERLVPRDLPQDDDAAAKSLRDALCTQHVSVSWPELTEAQRSWYRVGARAVLEAAGVERLRAELESCRSVNAALNSKLEGEKRVSELLREAQEASRAVHQTMCEKLAAAEKDRDEQKARADRAEERSQELATLMLGANREFTHRIAALEKAASSAVHELGSTTWSNESPVGREARNNAAVLSAIDVLRAAIDSAQPAPDRKCFCVPGACPDESKPAPDARDERIRELEAEVADRLRVYDDVHRNWDAACRRYLAQDERIRVACAELRQIGTRLNDYGWWLPHERIARELEGKDSANVDSGQPASDNNSSATPGREGRPPQACGDAGSNPAAGCSSPLPVSTELLGRLRRAKSVDIIIRKDGLERRFQADWLKTMARKQDSRPVSEASTAEGPTNRVAPSGGESVQLDTLCLIAAQFETMVMHVRNEPLASFLNGPYSNSGPDYARGLVERMRARLETR